MPRHTIIPAVYLILQNQVGEICLSKRYNTGYMDGFYSLPAGHLEGGEDLIAAIKREALEEIGAEIEDPKLVFTSYNLTTNPERIDFFFLCSNWNGQIINLEPNKCDELLWCNPKNLPETTTVVVKAVITSWLSEENYVQIKP